MENKGKNLPGGVTQQQVDAWKKEFGRVRAYTVKRTKNEAFTCYLKTPDRKCMGAALQAQKSDPIKAKEIILTNCWLGGNDQIKTDDDLFISVAAQLDDLIEIKEVEVKEL